MIKFKMMMIIIIIITITIIITIVRKLVASTYLTWGSHPRNETSLPTDSFSSFLNIIVIMMIRSTRLTHMLSFASLFSALILSAKFVDRWRGVKLTKQGLYFGDVHQSLILYLGQI